MAIRTRSGRTSQLEKLNVFQAAKLVGRTRRQRSALPADNTPEKQRARATGTDPAISIFSETSSPAQTWGGRRNRADRISDSISLGQASNIIAAAQFAQTIRKPFNRHITIHWEHAGVPDDRAAAATGQFLKLAGDWVASRGGSIAYSWVRENDAVFGSLYAPVRKGSHVHILIHLPAGVESGRMHRRWLRAITGQPYRANTIRTTRIGGTVNAWRTVPAVYQANLSRVMAYVLKGTCAAAVKKLRLTEIAPGGRIIGRRVSTSENVGRTARERIGPPGGGVPISESVAQSSGPAPLLKH